jgi:four helix bundle protein
LLEKEKRFVLARQLLKSGTSIGANVREAQNAESKADFIHKLKIAAKEAEMKQIYWLMLFNTLEDYPDCKSLLTDCASIIRVISKIIVLRDDSHNALFLPKMAPVIVKLLNLQNPQIDLMSLGTFSYPMPVNEPVLTLSAGFA